MKRIIFTKLAGRELEDAIHYYEVEYPGLGKRFRSEVKKAVLRITEYPLAWSVERGDIRKCLLHKFPYKLLYAVEDDHIVVIAVAHQHRKPDYWADSNET